MCARASADPRRRRARPLTPALLFSLDRRADPARTLGTDSRSRAPEARWWQEHEPALWGRAAWGLDATGFLVAQLTGVPVLDRISRGDWLHRRTIPRHSRCPSPPSPSRSPAAYETSRRDPSGCAPARRLPSGPTTRTPTRSRRASTCRATHACCSARRSWSAWPWQERLDVPGLAACDYLGAGLPARRLDRLGGLLARLVRTRAGRAGRRLGPRAAGAGGLLALPYFAGERTPVWDPRRARRRPRPDPRDASRGALPSARGRGRALGARPRRAAADGGRHPSTHGGSSGGGIQNEAWLDATCDALVAPLEVVEHATEAVGPALVAMRAIGVELTLPVARRVAARSGARRALRRALRFLPRALPGHRPAHAAPVGESGLMRAARLHASRRSAGRGAPRSRPRAGRAARPDRGVRRLPDGCPQVRCSAPATAIRSIPGTSGSGGSRRSAPASRGGRSGNASTATPMPGTPTSPSCAVDPGAWSYGPLLLPDDLELERASLRRAARGLSACRARPGPCRAPDSA